MSRLGEEEMVRKTLSQLTGSPFESTNSSVYHVVNAKWLVACRDGYYAAKAPHVTAAWGDEGGNIWLESMSIGNVTGWVEDYYGENGARTALKMDLRGFSTPDARKNL